MANEYNKNKDRITEKELVPDILERLTLSADITDSEGNVLVHSGTSFADVIKLLNKSETFESLPILSDAAIVTMKIEAGKNHGEVVIDHQTSFNPKIYYAVSKQTGIDYTDCLSLLVKTSMMIITLDIPIPFLHDEEIKIYVL